MAGIVRRIARHPRGSAAAMFGVLLPLILGFVTLSIDTAVLALTRAQLSTAADSAALASVAQLADDYRTRGITDLTPEITAANTQAAAFAQANHALGAAPVVNQNPNNTAGGDIVVGYLAPGTSSTLSTAAPQATYNSVQVTLARSSTHGGIVPTFFGQVMGFKGSAVVVQSTATAQPYSVQGFKSVNSLSAQLLPIVLDTTTYNKMISQQTTDQYTYNPATKTVTAGADGVFESLLYPVSAGLPGNWGTINVGVTNNSTSILGNQISNGITPAQLATFPNGTIQLNSALSPPSITFSGNTGISAGIKDNLTEIIGRPVTIPIYDQSGGNGDNATYRVIAFAPVRIVKVNFQGNPKYVIVQPAQIKDPTAIAGSPTSWTSGGLVKLHLSR